MLLKRKKLLLTCLKLNNLNLYLIGYCVKIISMKFCKGSIEKTKINKDRILSYLQNKDIGLEVLKKTTSTNDYIKKHLEKSSFAVIAKSQTKGRGRLNRTFYSPKNRGIYMSVLIKPNAPISKSVRLTTLTATIVANAIEKLTKLSVNIKWVNDLFINGKKVSGILTESSSNFNSNKLDYAVIGIGINVFGKKFNKNIKDIATSIENESKIKIDVNQLIALIIDGFTNIEELLNDGTYINEYKKRLFILNKQITVINSKCEYQATAVDVNDDGALIVSNNGKLETINAGEVSIKI